jgi:hypothetical protein
LNKDGEWEHKQEWKLSDPIRAMHYYYLTDSKGKDEPFLVIIDSEHETRIMSMYDKEL